MAQPPDFMLRALELAHLNIASGGGPFGAVVVLDQEVVGEGANRVTADHDPTAHAEIVAIRAACARLDTFHLEGAVIYCSCEPCPMCLGAILWARIAGMVYAAGRDDAAAVGFDDAAFYREVSRPASERTIPAQREHITEGRAVLRTWLASPNRIPY